MAAVPAEPEAASSSRCPSCAREGKKVLVLPGGQRGSGYSLHCCAGCSLVYLQPVPTVAQLARIYSGEYWARASSVRKGGMIARLVSAFDKRRLAATIAPLLERLASGSAVLEVGCGVGQLAGYLSQRGFHVEVTEIDQDLLDEVRAMHGLAGHCGSIEDVRPARTFDAIVFNNVLEHIPDPARALARVSELLVDGGLLFIEVPNIKSLQFRLFGSRWYHLQVPDHLVHFSPATLAGLTAFRGFDTLSESTFSPRGSAAGYAASLVPSLRPERLRRTWSAFGLLFYLALQGAFLPLAFLESLFGKGSCVRVVCRKRTGA